MNVRFNPTAVKKLSNKGIIKVTAGSYHTLLLSSQGKVCFLSLILPIFAVFYLK